MHPPSFSLPSLKCKGCGCLHLFWVPAGYLKLFGSFKRTSIGTSLLPGKFLLSANLTLLSGCLNYFLVGDVQSFLQLAFSWLPRLLIFYHFNRFPLQKNITPTQDTAPLDSKSIFKPFFQKKFQDFQVLVMEAIPEPQVLFIEAIPIECFPVEGTLGHKAQLISSAPIEDRASREISCSQRSTCTDGTSSTFGIY